MCSMTPRVLSLASLLLLGVLAEDAVVDKLIRREGNTKDAPRSERGALAPLETSSEDEADSEADDQEFAGDAEQGPCVGPGCSDDGETPSLGENSAKVSFPDDATDDGDDQSVEESSEEGSMDSNEEEQDADDDGSAVQNDGDEEGAAESLLELGAVQKVAARAKTGLNSSGVGADDEDDTIVEVDDGAKVSELREQGEVEGGAELVEEEASDRVDDVAENDESSSLADRVDSEFAQRTKYPDCSAYHPDNAHASGTDIRRRRACPAGSVCVRRRRFGHIRWDKEPTFCLQVMEDLSGSGPMTRLGMKACTQMGDDGQADMTAQDMSSKQDFISLGPPAEHQNKQFTFGEAGSAMCSGTAALVADIGECCYAAQKLGKVFAHTVDLDYEPTGCFTEGTTHMYYNTRVGQGNSSSGSQRVCQNTVAESTNLPPFRLQWLGDGQTTAPRCVESRRREYAQPGDVVGVSTCATSESMFFATQEVISCRRRRRGKTDVNSEDKCFHLKWHGSSTQNRCMKVQTGPEFAVENSSFTALDVDHSGQISEDEWMLFFVGNHQLMLADCSQDDETQIFH